MSKVYLGMSGGVDSSVSAVLLKEQSYDVTGVYMKNWSKDLPGMKCPWAEDLADAKRVAVQLDLDFEVWDFEADYKQKVVDYMLAEFQKGRTPNPDIMCNEQIKFKLFYDRAMAEGADYIATGHYARVERGQDIKRREACGRSSRINTFSVGTKTWASAPERPYGKEYLCDTGNRSLEANDILPAFNLLRAVDENKDQTYFLYRMSNAATAKTIFPVGGMTKPEVKALAAEKGLDVATKKESMGVCFVGEVGMKDFLKEYLDTQPGEIRDAETDQILGYHDGAIFYTIGQRHGLYLGGGLPYYVVKKDLAKNIVYVSRNLNDANLWSNRLKLENIHWRTAPQPQIQVRLRHRAPLINATVTFRESPRQCEVTFATPVKRPAAGQSVVFYDGEVCLGGGIISE